MVWLKSCILHIRPQVFIMKYCALLLLFFYSTHSFGKKIAGEFGLGLGYQPRMQLTRQGGSMLKVFTTRGFPSIEIHTGILYSLHANHRIGIVLNVLNLPYYFRYDLSGTQYLQNNVTRKATGNMQSDLIGVDLGMVYRKYFVLAQGRDVFFDIMPALRLNGATSVVRMGVADGNDSVMVFQVNYHSFPMLNYGARLSAGFKKQLKRNYFTVSFYYNRFMQNMSGTYISMPSTPDYNYGTFRQVNHQAGIKLIIGLGS